MRFLFGDALPAANIKSEVSGWIHFTYALNEAPHTTGALWKVTRFIAGIRQISDTIKTDEVDGRGIRYNDVTDHWRIDDLIERVPIVSIPNMIYPKRFGGDTRAGRKNKRRRLKAHYEAEYARCMGLRVKRLYYEGYMTVHTVYAAALRLEEFVTDRLNEHTNQPKKPDHAQALKTAVKFYTGAKEKAVRDKWTVKLTTTKRKESDRSNAMKARSAKQAGDDKRKAQNIAAIKKALPSCTKPSGKPDTKAISDRTGVPRRTVQRYLKFMEGAA